jgi:hypothetical protein
MTREEAKKIVHSVFLNYLPFDGDKKADEVIEALKQDSILDKIKAEIEQIEINGHIRDVECFRAGINVALNVIDKYKTEKESE